MSSRRALVVAALAALAWPAHAQPAAPPVGPAQPPPPPSPSPSPSPSPPPSPSDALRAGNDAATVGDWAAVSRLVDPLLRLQLPAAELAEAHRLAGLAAYFQDRRSEAEAQFLAYLRLDLDGQLDPALYPPEVVMFFNDVRARHGAELRARRPKSKRYWVLNLLPPAGQFQNGDRTKGFVLGGALATLAITHVTSFFVLRSWCTRVTGDEGASLTCDDRVQSARQLRAVNLVTGVGLILTYAYGVYDGAQGYRSDRRLQPYVTASGDREAFVGVAGAF